MGSQAVPLDADELKYNDDESSKDRNRIVDVHEIQDEDEVLLEDDDEVVVMEIDGKEEKILLASQKQNGHGHRNATNRTPESGSPASTSPSPTSAFATLFNSKSQPRKAPTPASKRKSSGPISTSASSSAKKRNNNRNVSSNPKTLNKLSLGKSNPSNASRFVDCPFCGASVVGALIDMHVNRECKNVLKEDDALGSAASPAESQASQDPIIVVDDEEKGETAPSSYSSHSHSPVDEINIIQIPDSQPGSLQPTASTVSPSSDSQETCTPTDLSSGSQEIMSEDSEIVYDSPIQRSSTKRFSSSSLDNATDTTANSTPIHPIFMFASQPITASQTSTSKKRKSTQVTRSDIIAMSESSGKCSYTENATPEECMNCVSCMRIQPPNLNTAVELYYRWDKDTCSSTSESGQTPFDPSSGELRSMLPSLRFIGLTPSQLKSLLQKNIRLSRPAAAVRAAVALILSTSLEELVRRLPIIMLEDAILHPLFPALIWLTGALVSRPVKKDNSFTPTFSHVNMVLQIVFDIAAIGIKDERYRNDDVENLNVFSEITGIEPDQLVYIKTILIRACLGGKLWDTSMLHSYCHLWVKRFQKENLSNVKSPQDENFCTKRSWLPFLSQLYQNAEAAALALPIGKVDLDIREVGSLQDDDILLSAIDQHCSSIVTDLLKPNTATREIVENYCKKEALPQSLSTTQLEQEMESLVASILWKYRGSITNKYLFAKLAHTVMNSSSEDSNNLSILQAAANTSTTDSDGTKALFESLQLDIDLISRDIVAKKVRRRYQ